MALLNVDITGDVSGYLHHAQDIAVFDERIGGDGIVDFLVVFVQMNVGGLGWFDGFHGF